MSFVALCKSAAESLQALPADHRPDVLVGFDGFIDHIIDVVDKRQTQADYASLARIADFGEKISAAAGESMNFELVVKQTKIGGNGPIMANAMLEQGSGVTYIGILGEENAAHQVFQPLVDRADQVHIIGAPAQTDALEFTDGKLMLGKLTPMDVISYQTVLAAVGGVEALTRLLSTVTGVATVNWTMTLSMTEIWNTISAEILPGLRSHRPLWFVDLADPAKRTEEDLRAALDALVALQAHADVILGLNGSEARQVVDVLGGSWSGDHESTESAREGAVFIRQQLGLSYVMVHLVGSAAAATSEESVAVPGFKCPNPVITTGAGDHFNAGFFSSLLAGLPLDHCCTVGGATSGYYVRNALPPSRQHLIDFLNAWKHEA